MKGVQFLINDKGEKQSVILDLKSWGALWEDFYDVMISESRKNEKRVSWDNLKKEPKIKINA